MRVIKTRSHTVSPRSGLRRSGFVIYLLLLAFGLAALYAPERITSQEVKALDRCRTLAAGPFRSYSVSWESVTWPNPTFPHWECHDRSHKKARDLDLGYWMS